MIAAIIIPHSIFDSPKISLAIAAFLLSWLYYGYAIGNVYSIKTKLAAYTQIQKEMTDYDSDCSKVSEIIESDTNKHTFLLTFDKNLCNHIFTRAIFASYETEFPQFLFNTYSYGNNTVNWHYSFPDLPTQIFNYAHFRQDIATGRVKYLILNKSAPKPYFLGTNFDKFKIKYKTAYFDIYSYPD
jgi:hypothetical protein